MAIKGVLFDFSGTLMRIESADSWLRAAAERTGTVLDEAELVTVAAALEAAGALPGGSAPTSVPPELAELWRVRDVDASHHRDLYTGLARQVALPDPELYDALYERHWQPAAWHPYPDTAAVLRGLSERNVGVVVVSNIGWDVRPVFRAHGLAGWVDAFVLSYEHGVQKPDPRLFRIACDALGLAPEQVLMVGDDARADGGAAALGCAVHLVDHRPVDQRPEGLLPVLRLIG
ncbi:HAD family hydrolase [Streptomyces litchfieldiae]|uniref:HAD-IA family hydrolase n=1 Tax=Streptomyces litchfieldiae TaxID=3075543 RepID=A0ABU2N0P3_9ACTN|nr:HAD-IA family hydrolase [Streptomyces sp. DSM 44938]MDT0347172.1 HAD-IA family hydrolase [Streptomyces sp. DSM 44938]